MVGMGKDGSTPGPNEAAEQTILNYAFVHETLSGGTPSPLPLTVPKDLVNVPAATLRAFIVSSLESEGVAVKQYDLRFWRVRRL